MALKMGNTYNNIRLFHPEISEKLWTPTFLTPEDPWEWYI